MGKSIDPMLKGKAGSGVCRQLPALIGIDESPAGYSLAGCAPAEPASASPAEARINQNAAPGITKNSKRQMRQTETVST